MIKFEKAGLGQQAKRVKIVHRVDVVNFNVASVFIVLSHSTVAKRNNYPIK